jgi:type I restriction enzyme S subunit
MSEVHLPQGWCTSKISDISIKGEQRKPSGAEAFIYVDIGSINRDLKSIESPQRLIGKDAPSRARKVISTGDVLVSLTRPNLNAVALVPSELDNQIASTGFEVIKPLLVDHRYIFSLTRSKNFIDSISGAVQGALYPAAKSSDVQAYTFPLPPLAEQKAIADKLDIMLTQVEVTKVRLKRIPEILKNFRQSVLSAAISGKLTEEWREVNGFSYNDWEQVLAADVCLKITDGEHQTPKRQDQGRMLLSAKNIRDGFIDYENHDLISEEDFNKCLKRCYAEINDVLIVSVGATIGRAAIKKDDIEFALVRSVGLFKIAPEKIIGDYLLYSLQSQKIQNFISKSSRGNAQPTLYIKAMSAIPIALPPLIEQKEIVRHIEELFAFADCIEQKSNAALEQVKNLTQSILAKAFRGDLTAGWRAANPELISGGNSAKALLTKIKAERKAIKKQPKPKRPAVDKKTGNRMSKPIKVVEALKHAGEPLSGQQLLAAAGYPSDSSTEQLEQFFLDIRDALVIDESIVKLDRGDDSQDWFALAKLPINRVKN